MLSLNWSICPLKREMEGSLVRFGDHQQYFEVEFVLLQNEVWQVEPGAAARRVSALMSEWGGCGAVETHKLHWLMACASWQQPAVQHATIPTWERGESLVRVSVRACLKKFFQTGLKRRIRSENLW